MSLVGPQRGPNGALECRGCRASGGFCSSGLHSHAASCDLEHRTGCRGRCVPVSRCIGRRIKVHATCLAWSSVATQTLHLQVPTTSLSSPSTPQGRCATAHAALACRLPHMPTIACTRYSLSTIWLHRSFFRDDTDPWRRAPSLTKHTKPKMGRWNIVPCHRNMHERLRLDEAQLRSVALATNFGLCEPGEPSRAFPGAVASTP